MSTVTPRVRSHGTTMPDSPWVKARRSQDGGNCVELRRRADAVEVRDSKNPAGPVLRFADAGVTAWLTQAREGALDRLLD